MNKFNSMKNTLPFSLSFCCRHGETIVTREILHVISRSGWLGGWLVVVVLAIRGELVEARRDWFTRYEILFIQLENNCVLVRKSLSNLKTSELWI